MKLSSMINVTSPFLQVPCNAWTISKICKFWYYSKTLSFCSYILDTSTFFTCGTSRNCVVQDFLSLPSKQQDPSYMKGKCQKSYTTTMKDMGTKAPLFHIICSFAIHRIHISYSLHETRILLSLNEFIGCSSRYIPWGCSSIEGFSVISIRPLKRLCYVSLGMQYSILASSDYAV